MGRDLDDKHHFQAISCKDVVVGTTAAGAAVVMDDPESGQGEYVGCKICELPLEEALRVPCPGMPVQRVEEGS